MDAPLERDDEIHFALLLVAKVKHVPVFSEGIPAEICVLQQTTGHEILDLSASGLIVGGSAIQEICPPFFADTARDTARIGLDQKDDVEFLEEIGPVPGRGRRNAKVTREIVVIHRLSHPFAQQFDQVGNTAP